MTLQIMQTKQIEECKNRRVNYHQRSHIKVNAQFIEVIITHYQFEMIWLNRVETMVDNEKTSILMIQVKRKKMCCYLGSFNFSSYSFNNWEAWSLKGYTNFWWNFSSESRKGVLQGLFLIKPLVWRNSKTEALGMILFSKE